MVGLDERVGAPPRGAALLAPEHAAGSRLESAGKAARAKAAARYATGVACILVVAVIWSFASVLVQYIFLDANFYRPFFLTYVANSLFVVNLPVWRLAVWGNCASDPHAPGAGGPDTAVDTAEFEPAVGGGEVPSGGEEEDEGSDGAEPSLPTLRPRRALRAWTRLRRAGRAGGDRLAYWAETGSLAKGVVHAPGLGALGAEHTGAGAAGFADAERRYARVPYVAVLRISLLICPIWFGANLAYITSLALTSVTSSTIISTTSSLFTFVLSIVVLDEQATLAKLAGVLLCMGGNVLTAFADRESHSGPTSSRVVAGDLICLLGALLYGLYTVLIRRLMPDDSRFSLALFFGLLGLANGLALLPVVLALHFSGVEPLDGLSGRLIGMIVVKGLLDNVLSDYLWAKAIVLTSPTAATVGLSFTIPIAMATDSVLHGLQPTSLSLLAALCVCGGFVMINVGSCHSNGCSSGVAGATMRRVREWRQRRPRRVRGEPLFMVVGHAGVGGAQQG
ncbi:hypothetical protein T492DRAFT_1106074 [Pavlovales sp. CCMP2436]|nr:hypothetical protein T492DRAFT_1106074 [Pavlovales sp. CCMP2436]